MSYQCEVHEQPAQSTLSVRTRTPVAGLPEVCGGVYGAIAQYLGKLGEYPAGPPFVAYYNLDMQDLDVEVGFPVSRTLPGEGDLQAGQIPAGKVATCLHVGPYHEVGAAYAALSAWMEANGHRPTGVAYEIYLNDPAQTRPDELQTQVMFLLE